MSAEILALLDSDPAAGIIAAANLREQRAKAATPGIWFAASRENHGDTWWLWSDDPEQAMPWPLAIVEADGDIAGFDQDTANAEHIAAEADPAHALAAASSWRTVAAVWDRLPHATYPAGLGAGQMHSPSCDLGCSLQTAVMADVRAYLGGAP